MKERVCAVCGRLVELNVWGELVHEGGTATVKECLACGRTWDAERYQSECPWCGSRRVVIDHRVRVEE